jgi:hypothetical protein
VLSRASDAQESAAITRIYQPGILLQAAGENDKMPPPMRRPCQATMTARENGQRCNLRDGLRLSIVRCVRVAAAFAQVVAQDDFLLIASKNHQQKECIYAVAICNADSATGRGVLILTQGNKACGKLSCLSLCEFGSVAVKESIPRIFFIARDGVFSEQNPMFILERLSAMMLHLAANVAQKRFFLASADGKNAPVFLPGKVFQRSILCF